MIRYSNPPQCSWRRRESATWGAAGGRVDEAVPVALPRPSGGCGAWVDGEGGMGLS